MTENQTIKDRLLLFIRESEMSVYAFEKQCGLSQGYVKNLGKSISTDKLGKITQHFPILSPSWLMFGEGSMYYNEIDLAADMIRSKAEREQQAHEPPPPPNTARSWSASPARSVNSSRRRIGRSPRCRK